MKNIAVYSSTGEQTGVVEIACEQPIQYASSAYAVSIRRLLQQWRQGTVGFKTRSDVAFSNRKPWKQKGTGRARAGSLRSPVWRKGGVVFGPCPRVRGIGLSRKQRQLAMNHVMAGIVASDRFYCLDAAFEQKPSVKSAQAMLKALNVDTRKVVLFLALHDVKTFLSFRNIPNVYTVFYDQPNAFDLSNGQAWVFLKKDLNLFTDMVAQWN